MWTWGLNAYGELGFPPVPPADAGIPTPTQVGSATDWSNAAGGRYFTTAVKTNGTLWAFGVNDTGQLGTGDLTSRQVPTQIGSATNWSETTAGNATSLGIRTDGTLWGWGDNFFGELGVGNNVNRLVPTQVGAATDNLGVINRASNLGLTKLYANIRKYYLFLILNEVSSKAGV